jgi:hypothetical protein
MEMFLMVLGLSVIGVAVCAVLFAAATRDISELGQGIPAQVRPPAYVPPQFFAEQAGPAISVPTEVLLLQLERHIRVEQAAAEAFLHYPTAESLHMRTTSPLVH